MVSWERVFFIQANLPDHAEVPVTKMWFSEKDVLPRNDSASLANDNVAKETISSSKLATSP